MPKPQTGKQGDQTNTGGHSDDHSLASMVECLDAGSLGQHRGDTRGTLDDVRLEHWMLRRPRLPRHVAEDLRTRTAGAVRIRVRPQRQVLNCLHELSEVGVCDVVNWLNILHRLPICYSIPSRRIRSLIRPRAREMRWSNVFRLMPRRAANSFRMPFLDRSASVRVKASRMRSRDSFWTHFRHARTSSANSTLRSKPSADGSSRSPTSPNRVFLAPFQLMRSNRLRTSFLIRRSSSSAPADAGM